MNDTQQPAQPIEANWEHDYANYLAWHVSMGSGFAVAPFNAPVRITAIAALATQDARKGLDPRTFDDFKAQLIAFLPPQFAAPGPAVRLVVGAPADPADAPPPPANAAPDAHVG